MKNIDIININQLNIPTNDIVEQLNRLTKSWHFTHQFMEVSSHESITKPATFKEYTNIYINDFGKAYLQKDLIIYVSDTPFRDGFFYDEMFEEEKRITIISLANWAEYSDLPKENGLLHFFNMTLSEIIDGSFRHYENTGCIYDFLLNKKGVDDAMKKGMICKKCEERVLSQVKTTDKVIALENLNSLLKEVSMASNQNVSIVDYWNEKGKNKIRFSIRKNENLNFRQRLLENELAEIKKKVAEYNLDKTFVLLKEYANLNYKEALNEIDLLELRWNNLLRNERLGIVDYNIHNLERNKILYAILNLITELEKKTIATL